MTALKFISVNARGLNISHKRTTVLEFLRKKNIDFALIQESHLLSKDAGRLANKLYHPIATSSAVTKCKGVMVLCKRKLKFDLIDSWSDDAGRIAIAKIRMDGKNIALISAYAPNVFDVAFYHLLTKTLLDLTGFQLVLGADFNAVWDNSMDKTGGIESRDQRLASEALRQWAYDTGMVDIWRMLNPSLKDFSFYSARHKSFSRLDFIFASKDLFQNIQDAHYIPVTWSDHKPVYCSVTVRPSPTRATRWRFNSSLLRDELFKTQFESNFSEFLEFNVGSVSDPRILWEAVKGFIRSNSTLYASTRNRERAAKLEALELKYATLDAILQHNFNVHIALQKELIKKEINSLLKRRSEFLMHKTRQNYYFNSSKPSHLLAMKLRTDEHFADIFCIKDKDGIIQSDPKTVNASFASFYQELYESENNFDKNDCNNFLNSIELSSLSSDDSAELDGPVTLQECEAAVKDMRKGKSPGPDGIPPEFYVTFWPLIGPLLVDMIQYSIKEGSFLRDVNSALISLLLKKGKDPTECSSYRPLSLLNADLKIYAKLLARRLQNHMTELVHSDQTGFIKSRLATDNVRRLLHVIDGAQSLDSPAAVLSLDAMKAFDRLEWPFLWSVLESMGFGLPFINMVKVLYKNPSAVVLTGKTTSPPFAISRGSRQGCPLSPLLFALSLEPLAQAIRSSPTISPISISGTHHHVSLYADDVLLYLNNPAQCIPHVLSTFENYGKLSGFKINWQKSALLPLNQAMCNASIPASIPVTKNFIYLGIDIYSSIQAMIKNNFGNTLNKVVADLDRWSSLPNSLRGRVAIIKMNILPRVNFVSSMLPLPPPPQFWSKLQSAISKFLWRGKRPRIKLTTMQRERQAGGLSLPNFKFYYWAFTLRPLLTWFQPDAQVSWRALEERLLAPYSFVNILQSSTSIKQCRLRFGPLISHLLFIWRRAEKLAGCSSGWGPHSPIFNNDKLLIGGRPICFPDWERKNIRTLSDIYGEGGLLTFQDICKKYGTPRTSFFFYLQLRSSLEDTCVPLQGPLTPHPLHKLFRSAKSTTGFVSRLYWFLLQHSYRPLALDAIWRRDVSDLKPAFDWGKVWINVHLASRNPDHQQIHYNFVHRVYLTPRKLHLMKVINDPLCTFCSSKATGSFFHMFWECPPVAVFWRMVAFNLSKLFKIRLPCLPATLILNDLSDLVLTLDKKRALLAGLTAGKKLVATRWKPPHSLSFRAWIMMYLDIVYLELSTARVHGAKESAINAWHTLLTTLRGFPL